MEWRESGGSPVTGAPWRGCGKCAAAGKTRTDSTVRTIEEMAARVEEGVQTFQQIVASTIQQQLGIEQVMGALQNIRQASQQTAAGTREVETASANWDCPGLVDTENAFA